MPKKSNNIERIEILQTDTKDKHLVRIFWNNWKMQHILTRNYFLEMKELKIDPFNETDVWYRFNLENFRISHDFLTNRILIYKIK